MSPYSNWASLTCVVRSCNDEVNSSPMFHCDVMTDLDRLTDSTPPSPSILYKEGSLGSTTETTYWVDGVFQDDNVRAPRAWIVNAHLQQHNIYRMSWPAASSDLFPIEYVWDMIGRRIHQRQRPPATLAELGQVLQEKWNRLPQIVIG